MTTVDAPWPQPTSATRAPRSELPLDTFERRDPRVHEERAVPGAEESLCPLEESDVVLVPADALPALEALDERRDDAERGRHADEPADHAVRARVIGERDRLFGRQMITPARRVVGDVLGRGLRGAPLADVALRGAGLLRQLRGRHRTAGGQRTVETETLADDHQDRP
jgi:hypothetical protein